jgi:hypothetical protein
MFNIMGEILPESFREFTGINICYYLISPESKELNNVFFCLKQYLLYGFFPSLTLVSSMISYVVNGSLVLPPGTLREN